MYKAKDIIELKKRINKDNCTIQQFCGCFVDVDKNKISRINSKFLTLDNEEYLKWISIIKHLYAPKELYNKNIYLNVTEEFEKDYFMDPIENGEFSQEWLDKFYDDVIDTVEQAGRFVILLWLDSYDVIKRTTDNNIIDESEEVYTYITCAICPVELDKPALAYNPETSGFTNKDRCWQISNPDLGFIYPAFIDRSADREKMLFYTANATDPDWNFVDLMGVRKGITTTEYKHIIQKIIMQQFQERENGNPDKVWMNLSYRCHLTAVDDKYEDERKKLYPDELRALLILDNVAEHDADVIAGEYRRLLEDKYPYHWQLVEEKQVRLHMAISAHNKKLKVLTKANTFIRDNHGTNDLTGEIEKILNTERIE